MRLLCQETRTAFQVRSSELFSEAEKENCLIGTVSGQESSGPAPVQDYSSRPNRIRENVCQVLLFQIEKKSSLRIPLWGCFPSREEPAENALLGLFSRPRKAREEYSFGPLFQAEKSSPRIFKSHQPYNCDPRPGNYFLGNQA